MKKTGFIVLGLLLLTGCNSNNALSLVKTDNPETKSYNPEWIGQENCFERLDNLDDSIFRSNRPYPNFIDSTLYGNEFDSNLPVQFHVGVGYASRQVSNDTPILKYQVLEVTSSGKKIIRDSDLASLPSYSFEAYHCFDFYAKDKVTDKYKHYEAYNRTQDVFINLSDFQSEPKENRLYLGIYLSRKAWDYFGLDCPTMDYEELDSEYSVYEISFSDDGSKLSLTKPIKEEVFY